jgi:UPF0148 protein
VVCAENATAAKTGKAPASPAKKNTHEQGHACSCADEEHTCEGVMLTDELADTILSLCGRIKNEKDPDNVLALMNAVKAGTEALQILCQL